MNAQISLKDLETWANFILDHSLGGIQPDDVVMIKGERVVWPLLSILQDKVFAAGAVADMNIVAPDNNRGAVWGASIARHGTASQIRRTPEWNRLRYENMTKYVEVLGAEDPALFSNLPEGNTAEMMKADHPFKTIRLGKKWVITLYPTQGFADLEGMSLEEYTDVIVGASTTDPKMLEEVEEPLAELIEKAKSVRVETECPKTRKTLVLTMDITDRLPVKCTGTRNFPDGEVYTSPDANRVNGEIFVDLPVSYNGVTIEGIYLKLENGVIVEYSAEEGHDALGKIVETDSGSHRIGEVALGMNQGLQVALKHPLFVEKVGGTLHIAIGESYPQAYVKDTDSEEGKKILKELEEKGIYNRSAQHVDIVTDFRPGGAGKAVYLDDIKLEIKDNIWVIP